MFGWSEGHPGLHLATTWRSRGWHDWQLIERPARYNPSGTPQHGETFVSPSWYTISRCSLAATHFTQRSSSS